jgi:hypothetical protein
MGLFCVTLSFLLSVQENYVLASNTDESAQKLSVLSFRQASESTHDEYALSAICS